MKKGYILSAIWIIAEISIIEILGSLGINFDEFSLGVKDLIGCIIMLPVALLLYFIIMDKKNG